MTGTLLAALPSLTEPEAVARFGLAQRLDCFRSGTWLGRRIRVHDGELHLAGDLRLDFEHGWNDSEGLIVDGDLTVDGNIINEAYESGAFLYVTGNVQAKNLVAGGACIVIDGQADIEELVYAHYNDGSLTIKGETTAQLVMVDDHFATISATAPYWNSHDTVIGMPLSEYLHADVLVDIEPEPEDDDGDSQWATERADGDSIIARLKAGRSAVRAADDSRPRRSIAQWQSMVIAQSGLLRHAPPEAISEEVCLAAVQQNGWALQYVPAELRTLEICRAAMQQYPDAYRFVPESLRRPEFTELAVAEDGKNLRYVPLEQRTKDLCIQAVSNDTFTDALNATPSTHLGPDLYLRAVQSNGWNLKRIPVAARSRDVCLAAVNDSLGAAEHIPEPLRTELLAEGAIPPKREAQEVLEDTANELEEFEARLPRTQLGFAGKLIFGSIPPSDNDGAVDTRGWFESRPVFVMLLGALISSFALGVHLWLTISVWSEHGMWIGLATAAFFLFAEIYWAWELGWTSALALCCVASVIAYVGFELLRRKLAAKWAASGLLDEHHDA
ncbi:MAG: DUF4116 domain-containing protein [Pseudomonadota bacterium]